MEELCEDETRNAARIPGCVFVRPGDSPRTVFANAPDGQLVHIGKARPGQKDLICPECGARLVARVNGAKRVPHYAHYRKGECGNAGETALHRIAKDIILEAGYIMLPPFEVHVGSGRPEHPQPAKVGKFDAVDVEIWKDGFRPDLIGIRYGSDGTPIGQLIIEIRVTHAVDQRKLAKLRERGDSVVEIDLSGIDRNLDGPELALQILDEAPRNWLFHRNEEQLTEKALRARAAQEAKAARRKAFAIAKGQQEEKDRQAERARPPSLDPPQMAWAHREQRRWSVMNMEDVFERPAGDGVFDVSPVLWRAAVLDVIAPWCEAPLKLGFRPDPEKIAAHMTRRLRHNGWVKPTFRNPYRVWDHNRYREIDAVGDAVEAYLFDIVVGYGFTERFDYKKPDLGRARESLASSWKTYCEWRSSLLALKEALGKIGIDLRLGAEIPLSPECIDRLCAELPECRRFDALVPDYLAEILGRPLGWRDPVSARQLQDRGISLSLVQSISDDPTAEAIAHLARRRHDAQRQALASWAKAEAGRVAEAFKAMSTKIPGLPGALAERQLGHLCDAGELAPHFTLLPDQELKDPVREGKKEITRMAEQQVRLAEVLDRLWDLSQGLSCERIGTLVLNEGLAIALDHHVGQDRRHLKGLPNAEGVEFTKTYLEKLIAAERRHPQWADLARRALLSKPPGVKARLLDLFLGGFRVPVRKEVGEICRRSSLPHWIADPP